MTTTTLFGGPYDGLVVEALGREIELIECVGPCPKCRELQPDPNEPVPLIFKRHIYAWLRPWAASYLRAEIVDPHPEP